MRHHLLTLILLLTLAIGAAPAAAQTTEPPNIKLRLWPNPSSALRGDIVRYDLTVTNEGDGKASRTRVTFPFPKGQMSLVKVELLEKTTWVMERTDEKLVIMFGTLRRGEQRDARIFMKLEPGAAPDGAPIRIRATARHDSENGKGLRSNETALRVEGIEADVRPAVTVEPASAPAGTVLRFSVRNYFPEEKIFTWLNAPGGVIESRLSGRADEQGATTLDLQTDTLAPGAYSLVVYGDSSKTTTVAPFEVK